MNAMKTMQHGDRKAIIWETHSGWLLSVYYPVGHPEWPEGKVIDGGTYGRKCDSFEDAMDQCRRSLGIILETC